MKEDVLEQVVEDYLQLRGYFTIHNLRFKPDKVTLNTSRTKMAFRATSSRWHQSIADRASAGPRRSCKAWQSGFEAAAKLAQMRGERKQPKCQTWQHCRELWESQVVRSVP